MADRTNTNNVQEKTNASEVNTTSDVVIVFIRSQGPDMFWSQNAVFNPKKTKQNNFSFFAAKTNEPTIISVFQAKKMWKNLRYENFVWAALLLWLLPALWY